MLISLNSPLTLPDNMSGNTSNGTFQVKNASTTNTIQIISIKASCGCTLINNNITSINPLDVVDIPFSISTKGKKGYISKSIVVTYKYNSGGNDGKIETLNLKFNLNAL